MWFPRDDAYFIIVVSWLQRRKYSQRRNHNSLLPTVSLAANTADIVLSSLLHYCSLSLIFTFFFDGAGGQYYCHISKYHIFSCLQIMG